MSQLAARFDLVIIFHKFINYQHKQWPPPTVHTYARTHSTPHKSWRCWSEWPVMNKLSSPIVRSSPSSSSPSPSSTIHHSTSHSGARHEGITTETELPVTGFGGRARPGREQMKPINKPPNVLLSFCFLLHLLLLVYVGFGRSAERRNRSPQNASSQERRIP